MDGAAQLGWVRLTPKSISEPTSFVLYLLSFISGMAEILNPSGSN